SAHSHAVIGRVAGGGWQSSCAGRRLSRNRLGCVFSDLPPRRRVTPFPSSLPAWAVGVLVCWPSQGHIGCASQQLTALSAWHQSREQGTLRSHLLGRLGSQEH